MAPPIVYPDLPLTRVPAFPWQPQLQLDQNQTHNPPETKPIPPVPPNASTRALPGFKPGTGPIPILPGRSPPTLAKLCPLSHRESCFLKGGSLPWTLRYVSLALGSLSPVRAFLGSSAMRIFLEKKSDGCQAPPEKLLGPPSCQEKGPMFPPLVDTLELEPRASTEPWPFAAPPQRLDCGPVHTPSYTCLFSPSGAHSPPGFPG